MRIMCIATTIAHFFRILSAPIISPSNNNNRDNSPRVIEPENTIPRIEQPLPMIPPSNNNASPRVIEPGNNIPIDSTEGCIYEFQRGNKKGQQCGYPVAGDGTRGSDLYCRNCLKKRTVQRRLDAAEWTVRVERSAPVISHSNTRDNSPRVSSYRTRIEYSSRSGCVQILQYGDRKGHRCGRPTSSDGRDRYCVTCLNLFKYNII